MIGQMLGHYQIVERLGAGGTGEVFKARDTRQDGVCFLPRSESQAPISVVCWDSSTGKSVTGMGVVDKPTFSAAPAFSVPRDGKRFLWNQTDHQDADLVLVDNFR